MREVAAGLMVLGRPGSALGPGSRIAGDMLDIAVLAPALASVNPQRGAARVALARVVGITALDILCTSALVGGERRRQRTARRTPVAA